MRFRGSSLSPMLTSKIFARSIGVAVIISIEATKCLLVPLNNGNDVAGDLANAECHAFDWGPKSLEIAISLL